MHPRYAYPRIGQGPVPAPRPLPLPPPPMPMVNANGMAVLSYLGTLRSPEMMAHLRLLAQTFWSNALLLGKLNELIDGMLLPIGGLPFLPNEAAALGRLANAVKMRVAALKTIAPPGTVGGWYR